MGLLDDAIREHLDLKRRRGADPTEVEREEREVLGPVRRRGEPSPDDEHELELAHEDDLEHEPVANDSFSWGDDPFDGPSGDEPLPPAAAFDHEQIAPIERAQDPYLPAEPAREPDPYVRAEPDPEPYVPPQRAPGPAPYAADPGPEPPTTDQSTAEFSVEDALEHEDHPHREGEKEDVLEETPEFLQDTPDHDRLWFEQRPPRDFDFDG
jgi:hypothetical protein